MRTAGQHEYSTPHTQTGRPYLCGTAMRTLFTLFLVLVACLSVTGQAHAATDTISGNAYADESGTTVWDGCNGGGGVIGVAWNGTEVTTTTCNASGAFSVSPTVAGASQNVAVYFKSGGSGYAVTYFVATQNATAESGVKLTQNHVRMHVGTGTVANPTFTTINSYDADQLANIPVQGPTIYYLAMSETQPIEFLLETGMGAWYPVGSANPSFSWSLSVTALDVETGTYFDTGVASNSYTNSIVIKGYGTSACSGNGANVEMPLCFESGSRLYINSDIPPAIIFYGGNGSFTSTITFPATNYDNNGPTALNKSHWGAISFAPTSGSPTMNITTTGASGTSITIGGGGGTPAVTSSVTMYSEPNCANRGTGAIDSSSCVGVGSFTVNTNTSFTTSGSVSVYGNMSGAGTISQSAGTWIKYTGDTGTANTMTATSNNWSFYNLQLLCGLSATSSITLSGASYTMTVANALTVGDGSATISVDASGLGTLDVNGSITIGASTTFTASPTITDAGSFTNNGTFTAGTGTVTMDGSTGSGSASTMSYSAATSFYNLTITTADKYIKFGSGASSQTTITHTLTITGSGCGASQTVKLLPATASTAYRVNLATGATASVTYGEFSYFNAYSNGSAGGSGTEVFTANRSLNYNVASTDNNIGFTMTGCQTMTGTASNDTNTGGKWTPCDGSTTNLTIRVNSVNTVGYCNATTGVYTIDRVDIRSAGDIIVIWEDSGTYVSASYVSAASPSHYSNTALSSVSGVNVFSNYVELYSKDGSTMTNASMDVYDGGDDANIGVTITGNNLVGAATTELMAITANYSPGGNITIGDVDLRTTYTGAAGMTLTLLANGTSDCGGSQAGVQRPLCVATASGGTYTPGANETVVYTGSGGTIDLGCMTYVNLKIEPAASSGSSIVRNGNSLTCTTLGTSGTFTIGDGTHTTVFTTATYTPTMSFAAIDVKASATLQGTNSFTVTGSLSGAGTVNLTGGTLTQRVSADSTLGSTSGSNNWTFNTLNLENSSGSANKTISTGAGSGTYTVSGTLTIGNTGDTYTTTLDADTVDRTISMAALSVTTKGVFTTSSANTTTISGAATVNGTMTGSAALSLTSDFTGTGTVTWTSGTVTDRVSAAATFGPSGSNNWSFAGLTFENSSGAANRTISTASGGTGTVTASGTLTVGNSSDSFTTTLDADTNDRTMSVGALNITTKGVYTSSSANATTITGNTTVNGTLNGSSDITANGAISGTGTVTLTAGTVTNRVSANQTLGTTSGTNDWTFYNLKLENSSGAANKTISTGGGSGTYTISGTLTVGKATDTYTTTLDADTNDRTITAGALSVTSQGVFTTSSANTTTISGTATINGTMTGSTTLSLTSDFTGTGTVTWTAGTVTQRISSSSTFGPSGNNNWSFAALKFENSSGAANRTVSTASGGTGTVSVSGTMTVGNTGDTYITTLDADTNDRTFSAGTLTVTTKGVYTTSSANTTTVTGDITVNGTLNGSSDITANGGITGSGTVTLTAGTVTQRVSANQTVGATSGSNNWTFYNLKLENSSGAADKTFSTASGGSGTITTTGTLTVGKATDTYTTTLDADTNDRTVTTGPLTVTSQGVYTTSSANTTTIGGAATITGTITGTGTVVANADFTGAGTATFSSGTFTNRVAAAATFGPSSSNNWSFNTLTFSNSSGTNRTITRAAGTATVSTAGVLTVGAATDTNTTTLDNGFTSRPIDANSDVTVTSKGTLKAPTDENFTIAGSFTNNGTFTPGTGTVIFDTAGTANLTYTASTSFYNLRFVGASKTVNFDHSHGTVVTGTTGTYPGLTGTGSACGTPLLLQSDSSGSAFTIDVQGSAPTTLTYVRIKDSTATTAITSSVLFSTSGGNNTNWTIHTGACTNISLSITSGSSPDLGHVTPDTDGFAQTTLEVITNNAPGYSLVATTDSDVYTMTRTGGGRNIAPYSGTSGTPTLWSNASIGTAGQFGISVLCATSGRLSKWYDTQSCPYGGGATTDITHNKYAGLDTNGVTLHAPSTSLYTADDSIIVNYRLRPGTLDTSGAYTAHVTYTVSATA